MQNKWGTFQIVVFIFAAIANYEKRSRKQSILQVFLDYFSLR
jgi:dimeric dUTPase (all-alpha-NTP-PPase superfamily)